MERADDRDAAAGFGACAHCRFVAVDDVGVCARCAAATIGRATPTPASGDLADVWAAAQYGPLLAQAIHRYKQLGRRGWARVFSRLLLARLEELGTRARAYDVIVASPTFVGPGGREFDHTGLVLDWAQRQAPGRWPIAAAVVKRTRPVPALKDCRGWRARHTLARTELRQALVVGDRDRVEGASVLIFDDVMTTGATCGEVGGALLRIGATRVGAIVLARQALTVPSRSIATPTPRRSPDRPRAAERATADRTPAAPEA